MELERHTMAMANLKAEAPWSGATSIRRADDGKRSSSQQLIGL